MDSEETLKYLQQKYPEDLNENYRCYWGALVIQTVVL